MGNGFAENSKRVHGGEVVVNLLAEPSGKAELKVNVWEIGH